MQFAILYFLSNHSSHTLPPCRYSVIIGIALGVEIDKFKELLAALVFHQFFEGLALATVIIESNFTSKLTPVIMLAFYSLTTPIGIAIGIGIYQSFNANSQTTLLVTGTLDAISAGILIYDSLVNIITPHIACPLFRVTSHQRQACQLLALWTGATIMAVIGRWA